MSILPACPKYGRLGVVFYAVYYRVVMVVEFFSAPRLPVTCAQCLRSSEHQSRLAKPTLFNTVLYKSFHLLVVGWATGRTGPVQVETHVHALLEKHVDGASLGHGCGGCKRKANALPKDGLLRYRSGCLVLEPQQMMMQDLHCTRVAS